jgi:hypothetical protein
MGSDPFSDILKFTQAESLVTGGFTAGGSWALRFPAPDKIKFFCRGERPLLGSHRLAQLLFIQILRAHLKMYGSLPWMASRSW